MNISYKFIQIIILIIIVNMNIFSQNENIKKYKGNYKDGIASYSYFEDKNGNIILHGKFEYSHEDKDIDPQNKFKAEKYETIKGEFKNGKKEGLWIYTIPFFNSDESKVTGGGKTKLNITLDRDKITESNYEAEGEIKGDHYEVGQGLTVIKANYLNGVLNEDFLKNKIQKRTEYEKILNKAPKFIKIISNDTITNKLNFKNGVLEGEAFRIINRNIVLSGNIFSGCLSDEWRYSTQYLGSFKKDNVVEILNFSYFGVARSGIKYNSFKNDTIVNVQNDDIKILDSLMENYTIENAKNDTYGFIFKYHPLTKDYTEDDLKLSLSKYNDIPLNMFDGFFREFNNIIRDFIYISTIEIENYDNRIEQTKWLNFNDIFVSDESKLKKYLKNPFEKIYTNNLKAIGGENSIKKISSYKVKKEIEKMRDPNWFSSESQSCNKSGNIKWKFPNKYYYENPDCFDFTYLYFWSNDSNSIKEYNFSRLQNTSPIEYDLFTFRTMIFPLYQMKQQGYIFEVIGKSRNDLTGKDDLLFVKATSKNGLKVDLYFDEATYLIKEYIIHVNENTSDDYKIESYEDFKNSNFEGIIKLPNYIYNDKVRGTSFQYKYSNRLVYQLNVPINNSEFKSEYKTKKSE